MDRIVCKHCGQDWLLWYRAKGTDREFLLCPECDSVWLPGDDTAQEPRQWLGDLFPPGERVVYWDLIEPVISQ